MKLWKRPEGFEKKSLKKAWIRKGKDVIFALPNRKETGFEKLERNFKGKKNKEKKNLKKACRIQKELYFCSRFKKERKRTVFKPLNS